MPTPFSIPTYTAYAKIAQYLWVNDLSKAKIFQGGSLTPQYDRILYIVRKAIEANYAINPTDSTLTQTGDFIWSLIGKYQIDAMALYAGTGCIAPVITAQPLTQTVGAGGTVTFVTVATGTNLSYQWQYNSSNISGATLSTYTKAGLVGGDAGNYRCIVSNPCGSVNSNQAVLTVGAGDIVGYYYYGATDYYAALVSGTDTVPYQSTFPIVANQPLSVPFPAGAANNMRNITKYPVSQGLKIAFDNHTPNVGDIPSSVYYDIVTIGSFYYIISRDAMSLNSSFPMIFS